MKEMDPVDEEHYEINVDIHGIRDGPRLGRLRVLNKVRFFIIAVLSLLHVVSYILIVHLKLCTGGTNMLFVHFC